MMKRSVLAWIAAITLLAGCGKKEEPPPPAAPSGGPSASLEQAKGALKESAESLQKEADKVAAEAQAKLDDAKKAAETAAAQATSEFDALVAKIKASMDTKAYQDALADIQAGLKLDSLTATQQKTLQDLLAQVQKALAANAAGDATKEADKAVGGLLNKLGK